MESTLNLLSLNYISNTILNNSDSKNLLINNINEEDMLKVLNEITSNYLFSKEQVLIISDIEKSKILNEKVFKSLEKRLIDFQDNYDLNDRIKKLLLDLDVQTGKTIISKIELINRDIKKKYEILGQINNLFLNKNSDNISLIKKYKITESKISNFNSYYKYYKTFRIKKPLSKYSYSEIKESCKKILYLNLSSHYVKYRRFINNNTFKCLRQPINYNLINKAIIEISEIIKNKDISYNLIRSKYTSDFIDVFFLNETMNENNIISLSNIINLKYNYNLLNTNKKSIWFNIFKRKKRLQKEDKLNLFSNCQKEIYDEYINNYNSICSLKDKLYFLRDVLNDSSYIETLRNVVRGEDIYEILEFYLKIFEVAYKSKKSIEVINDISSIELDILNYCYEDLEEKKEINDLILSIPKLKLYLAIEEEEARYDDIIKIYNDYDKIIDNIFSDINRKNSLLYNAINNIWDNQLREGSSLLMENINYIPIESLNKFVPCVISNNSINELQSLINKKFYFKKVIVLLDDYYSANKNILNSLGDNIIILSKNNSMDINDFKIIDITELYNSYQTNNYKNILITEISDFLINKGLTKVANIKGNTLEILKIDSEEKIAIIVSPCSKNFDYNTLLRDIYSYRYYREHNIKTYRIWYRDWWVDKNIELSKLEKYIKEI